MSHLIKSVYPITVLSSASSTLESLASTVNIGNTTATATNVGRSGTNSTIGGNVLLPNVTLDNTKTQFLSYDTGTKRVFYGDVSSLPSATNIYNSNGTIPGSTNRMVNIDATSNLSLGDISGPTNTSVSVTPAGSTVSIDAGFRVNIATAVTSGSIEMGNVNCTLCSITADDTLVQGKLGYLTPPDFGSITHLLSWNGIGGVIEKVPTANVPNIYTLDGTLTSTRVMTIPASTNFTISGTNTSDYFVTGLRNITNSCSGDLSLTGNNNINMTTSGGTINIAQSSTTPTINIGSTGGVTDINLACSGSISLNGVTDVKLPSLSADTLSTYLMYFNNVSKVIQKAPIINDYAVIRFSAQTSQTITSASPPQILTSGTATALTVSTNTALTGSRNIIYSGVSRLFRISFTGNVSAAVASQNIGVSIFISGSEISDSNNSTQLQAAGSATLNTCEIIRTLATGDLITIGFSRSTSDTTVTFTGNLLIQTLTLNNLA